MNTIRIILFLAYLVGAVWFAITGFINSSIIDALISAILAVALMNCISDITIDEQAADIQDMKRQIIKQRLLIEEMKRDKQK